MNLDVLKVINSFDSGVIVLNGQGLVSAWNEWMEEYSQISRKDAINKSLAVVFKEKLNSHLVATIDDVLKTGRSRILSPRLHKHPFPLFRKTQQSFSEEIISQKTLISRLKTEEGGYYCIININDMTASVKREKYLKETQRKIMASEKEMRKMAFFDNLTSLANRALFLEHLDMALAQSKRHNYMTAIILIDIDYFKAINDDYGHDVGDQLLIEIAKRLKHCVRKSDTAARLGGDEFVVIQHKINTINDVTNFVNKIHGVISESVYIKDIKINPSSSIGVSVYPDDIEGDLDDDIKSKLLKNADIAMYQVKKTGRSGWKFFSTEMHREEELQQYRKIELSKAIADKKILVHYQPEIDMSNHQCAGFEALVRYLDSNNKIIMPDEFISIAEETGLITEITLALLDKIQATAQLIKGDQVYKVAINLSAKQFYSKGLIEKLIESHHALLENNFQLEIEITESVVMENTQYAIDIFDRLSKTGVSIALDGFGTGYSSLGYLKDFPINKLKIGRSFVNNLNKNKQNNIITNSIISLGHSLGLKVVAEGVETKEQHDYLKKENCDIAQGYYYCRPVDEAGLLELTKKQKVA